MIVKVVPLKRALSVFLLGVILLLGQTSGFAYAATKTMKVATPPPNTSPNGLKISPVRTPITIQPGKSDKVIVTVTNTLTAPIMVKPIENDFVAGDEKGTPAIILDENSYAPTHSLKRFMIPLQNIMIPAGQSKDVAVTITVPATAQAGGYFGALRFAPVNADGSTQVSVGASLASLILLTVPGDLVEKLTITNFDIQQYGNTASNFRTSKDLQLFLRFKNDGNVQLAPFGKVYVKKGDKVVYQTDFNNSSDFKDEILPDSARQWMLKLNGLGKFGKYEVNGIFGYGSKGQSLEIKKTVWIVPTTYIYLAIGSVVGLLVLITGFIIFLRSYKRRILRGSRRRY